MSDLWTAYLSYPLTLTCTNLDIQNQMSYVFLRKDRGFLKTVSEAFTNPKYAGNNTVSAKSFYICLHFLNCLTLLAYWSVRRQEGLYNAQRSDARI